MNGRVNKRNGGLVESNGDRMKLTRDQEHALTTPLITACGYRASYNVYESAAFLAGYRIGARDMRERAASIAIETPMGMTNHPQRIAGAIRSLPIEDEA